MAMVDGGIYNTSVLIQADIGFKTSSWTDNLMYA